jgi:carbonic anhydrase
MAVIDELIQANLEFVRKREARQLPMPPARHVAVVTCMDARIIPATALGLKEGDAHVIRNAGGRARDALRSLVISQRLLGTNEVAIIHHTDCGMLTFTNESLREKVLIDLGADCRHIDFLPFADLEQSVRDDIAFLRRSTLIPAETPIRGFVYDVASGQLSEVQP